MEFMSGVTVDEDGIRIKMSKALYGMSVGCLAVISKSRM